MHALYNNVQDFTIDVTKISSTEYVGKLAFPEMTHAEYLNSFEMVVLGFADVYVFGGKEYGVMYDDELVTEATLAIREYALSGRSIMFTHDLNSSMIDVDGPTHWGYYANKYLRDVQGMDRFGVIKDSGAIPAEDKYQYLSLYDDAELKGNALDEKMAVTNPVILSDEYKVNIARNVYGENARRASWQYSFFWNYHEDKRGYYNEYAFNSYVEQINAGQITEYPYKIDEVFEVTQSHPQYFQLNLDTDSRDENDDDDIVVWYTLGEMPTWRDSYFAAVEKDVRNNYFIYNKGNVTYTGSGDRQITSDMEKKLFVNTLVASYRTGLHAPRAIYKDNEWQTSATITGMYIPYDPEMHSGAGGFLEQQLSVHFYTTDTNLQRSGEQLHAKYYIEGSESEHDLYLDGRYYKEVQPKVAYRIVENNNSLVQEVESASLLANNSMHTVMFDYAEIGLGSKESIRDKYSTTIYVRLGHDELVSKAAGEETTLPAVESMNKLNVVCTQLFELK